MAKKKRTTAQRGTDLEGPEITIPRTVEEALEQGWESEFGDHCVAGDMKTVQGTVLFSKDAGGFNFTVKVPFTSTRAYGKPVLDWIRFGTNGIYGSSILFEDDARIVARTSTGNLPRVFGELKRAARKSKPEAAAQD